MTGQTADFTTVSPELLAGALDVLEEGIAIYDADERLVLFNKRYESLLGPMPDRIGPGARWRDLNHGCVVTGVATGRHPDDAERKDGPPPDPDAGAKLTEIRQLKDRYVEQAYHPTGSGGFVVTRTDVTDRHRAERLAEERDQLLRRILEANPIPVVMARLSDSYIVWRSPAARDLIGNITYAL